MTVVETPALFAARLVSQNHKAIEEAFVLGEDIRSVALRTMLVEDGRDVARGGLPAICLAGAAKTDPYAFDIVLELLHGTLAQPAIIEDLRSAIDSGDMKRPSRGRGAPRNLAGRDFMLMVLVAMVQAQYPDLPLGSNDVTEGAESATQVVTEALDGAGFEVLDGRKESTEIPEHRSVEKAVRRLSKGSTLAETFWD